jgi:hypothetical protein
MIKVAQTKGEGMLGSTLKNKVKELLGTCVSLGIKVEGKDPRAVIKEVNAGVYDKEIKAEKTELSADELAELQVTREQIQNEMEALEKAAAAVVAAAQATTPVAGAEGVPAAEGAAVPAPGAPAAVAPKQPAKEEKKPARKQMR